MPFKDKVAQVANRLFSLGSGQGYSQSPASKTTLRESLIKDQYFRRTLSNLIRDEEEEVMSIVKQNAHVKPKVQMQATQSTQNETTNQTDAKPQTPPQDPSAPDLNSTTHGDPGGSDKKTGSHDDELTPRQSIDAVKPSVITVSQPAGEPMSNNQSTDIQSANQNKTCPKVQATYPQIDLCGVCQNDMFNPNILKVKPQFCYRCLHKHIKDLDKKNRYYEEKTSYLKLALTKSKAETTEKAREIEAQNTFIQELSQRCEELNADFQMNESEIKRLQKKELAMNRQDDILTDEQAKNDIHQVLQTKVHKISRLFFRKIPWQELVSVLNNSILGPEVCRTFIFPWNHPSQWPLVNNNPHINTHTFVDALLSSTIADVMFCDPFFRWETKIGRELNSTYLLAMRKDAENATNWRADTIKLHNNLGQEDKQSPQENNSRLTQLHEFMFRSLAQMAQTHRRLPEGEILALDDAIFDLLESSAALADKWHEKAFQLQVINITWLQNQQIDWHSECATNYVTAFPRDDEFDSQKNYTIVAVKSPGFIRYEKAAAGEPLQEIVWEKASVLLAEVPQDESPVSPESFPNQENAAVPPPPGLDPQVGFKDNNGISFGSLGFHWGKN
ncbi:hypothetical protein Dda_1529 [Drechslerella dactyloides]|uniref:Uncharacterized protein n=1 Tax=Drechslerella dactyloides TaxID=74499 RepID=A0AAD6J2L6_DREDA|nr:hypothetical protein Dda_1529 [Drechslerella dactyloides]